MTLVEKEYLDKHKKGSLLPRLWVASDFTIGRSSFDEVNNFLKQYRLVNVVSRLCDLEQFIKVAMPKMTPWATIKNHEPLDDEDVVRNLLRKDEVQEKRRKWKNLMRVEVELKAADPSFSGFCLDSPYLERINKMLSLYETLMDKMPQILDSEVAAQ